MCTHDDAECHFMVCISLPDWNNQFSCFLFSETFNLGGYSHANNSISIFFGLSHNPAQSADLRQIHTFHFNQDHILPVNSICERIISIAKSNFKNATFLCCNELPFQCQTDENHLHVFIRISWPSWCFQWNLIHLFCTSYCLHSIKGDIPLWLIDVTTTWKNDNSKQTRKVTQLELFFNSNISATLVNESYIFTWQMIFAHFQWFPFRGVVSL